MIKAATLENRFETDLIVDALEKEGIEYVVKPFQDSAYDGIFVTQKGYAMLLVEEERREQAESIVAEIRESVSQDVEWDLPDEPDRDLEDSD